MRDSGKRADVIQFLKGVLRASGESENEVEELASALEALPLPPEVDKVVSKDLRRLRRMQPAQPEFNVILSYLEFVLSLPWGDEGPNKKLEEGPMTDEEPQHLEAGTSSLESADCETDSSSMHNQFDSVDNEVQSVGAVIPEVNENGEIDLERARQILDEDHYGLDIVKKRVLQYLAVCSLRKNMAGPILCLVGPPGVGKTSLGNSIARALRRKFHRLCLGGVRDEAEIRGHRRTYIGALPGQVLQAFARTGTKRPVLLLDEIDKLGHDARGDPAAALLEVLDPAQNNAFKDHYLAAPFDLSAALFIATANDLSTIPRPLLDRMELITLPSYSLDEKLSIARSHLIPKMEASHGLKRGNLTITTDALRTVIQEYTQEAGVRTLERKMAAICRHVALKKATTETRGTGEITSSTDFVVNKSALPDILGPCEYPASLRIANADECQVPGVALGLAWTPFGGDVLTIETARMPGTGRIILTGRLGETMQESAQIALGWIRSHSKLLGLDKFAEREDDDLSLEMGDQNSASSHRPKIQHGRGSNSSKTSTNVTRRGQLNSHRPMQRRHIMDGTDVHVHFPAGAVPKDGPSAGVAMTVALVSLFLGIPLPKDVAMTGEISLSGAVLPVGGIKEKVVAAHAAGCRAVILPHRNGGDLINVPHDAQDALYLVTADRIEDVLIYLFGALPLSPSGNVVRHSKAMSEESIEGAHRDPGSIGDRNGNGVLSPVHIGRQDAKSRCEKYAGDSTSLPLRSAL